MLPSISPLAAADAQLPPRAADGAPCRRRGAPQASAWPMSRLHQQPQPGPRRRRGGGGGGGGAPPGATPAPASPLAAPAEEEADEPPRFGVAAAQGPREDMEDLVAVLERGRCGYFYASVFDGHAGAAAAEWLAAHLHALLSDLMVRQAGADGGDEGCELPAGGGGGDAGGLCCPLQLGAAVKAAFAAADAALLAELAAAGRAGGGAAAGAGATATTVLLRPRDRLVVANVGDSRAVLGRGGRAPLDLTTEHRVWGRGAAVAAETARVRAAGGWVDDGRVCGVLAVSRAFGDAGFKAGGLAGMLARGVDDGFWDAAFADAAAAEFERAAAAGGGDPVTAEPDVLEAPLAPGDELLVVATDGLWDVVTSAEAVAAARRELAAGRPPAGAAERLVGMALARRTADNVAVAVVDLLGPRGWAEAAARGAAKKKKVFGLF